MEAALGGFAWVLLLVAWSLFRDWRQGRVPQEPAPLPPTRATSSIVIRRLGPGTRCHVCRGALEGDVIFCPSCATPQHRDCWTYVRGCSTYGCRRSA